MDENFRKKQESARRQIEFIPCEEGDNRDIYGRKRIKLLDKNSLEFIGSISFDYISRGNKKFIKVSKAVVLGDYQGSGLGLVLYKILIDLAQKKGLAGIYSDQIVQGGAIVSWRKLRDEGFKVSVYLRLLNKFEEFCKTYDEGKYFHGWLSTGSPKSVFILSLE